MCIASRRSVRMWFLAYAAGGLAVFLSTEGAWAAVRASTLATVAFCIGAFFFLVAIAIQILAEIYNKDYWQSLRLWIARQRRNPEPQVPSTFSHLPQFFRWFDKVQADFVTLGLLTVATAIIISILVAHDPAASPVPTALPVPCSHHFELPDTPHRADGSQAVVELDLDVVWPATAPGIDDPPPSAGDGQGSVEE